PSNGGEHQARHQRALLAQPLDDRADERRLHDDAEETERGEQIAGMRRVEVEPPRHEQRQRRLVDGKRRPVEKVDTERRARVGTPAELAQRRPRRHRDGVHAMHGLGQPEDREQHRDDGDRRGGPDRRGVTDVREEAAQPGADDEAETERRPEQAEQLGAVLRRRDVADIGARGGDVAARQPVHDAREEEHREALGQREHDEADDGTGEAEDEDGTAPPAVGPVAEHRRRDQLRERERRKQQPDRDRRRAERLRVERQQRNDDAEPDQVDEDRQEDDDERPSHYWRSAPDAARFSVTLLITIGVTGTFSMPSRVPVGDAPILSTTSIPSMTRPNTAYPKSSGDRPR